MSLPLRHMECSRIRCMIRKVDQNLIQAKQAEGEKLYLLEAGNLEDYDRAHIPKALHITLEEILKSAADYFPSKGSEIIVYGEYSLSQEPSEILAALNRQGFQNLYYYEGGKRDWIDSGLPVEGNFYPPEYPVTKVEKPRSAA
jgi:rhodanese-related sulfurtransferase